MSKLTVRVVLSVLISLGVIFAIYTTVQALQTQDNVVGTSAAVSALANPAFDNSTYMDDFRDSDHGGGCESERIDPNDF